MSVFLYIDNDSIGEVNFSIIDVSMGGIGGNLIANDNYNKYQPTIFDEIYVGSAGLDLSKFQKMTMDKKTR